MPRYVLVALDIYARSLQEAYVYVAKEPLLVGQTVLVPFGAREVAGYVIEADVRLPKDVDAAKIKPVSHVVSCSLFAPAAVSLARWMASYYAASFITCIKLFLPVGFARRLKAYKPASDEVFFGPAKKQVEFVERVDMAGSEGAQLRASAHRQRELMAALGSEPMRMQELQALVVGARTVVRALEKKGLVRTFFADASAETFQTTLSSSAAPRPEKLTDEQLEALSAIEAASARASGACVLVDGVTGSGKTEVYLEAIERVCKQDKRAIVLVPEISLTAQTVGRFNSRFGGKVGLLHSRMSDSERAEQWWRIKRGECDVVIGARSALFAPVENLGLVVIDEEHETSYKQDATPHYHAREVAKELVKLNAATLVLGSATPSEEALYAAATDPSFQHVRLLERAGNAELPAVEIVDMRGVSSVFSPELKEALVRTHARGEKSILLLNRRGFATFLMCEDCGCVPMCPHCSTSLTYHAHSQSLICHTCGRSWNFLAYPHPKSRCPNCGSPYLKQIGVGTERIESELHALMPDAVLVRMDADTTKTKDAHAKLLEAFDSAPASVLLGTQMIAKGLDFPEVTLVGVINADLSLKLPDFRAPERTYHLLEQVAGRAGRGENPGRVIIQTAWPTHPVFQAVKSHNRDLFIECDAKDRKEAYYPPYARLANVGVASKDEYKAQVAVEALAANLSRELEGLSGYELLGPAACMKHKVKDNFRFHVEVKAPLSAKLGELISKALQNVNTKAVAISVDIDSYNVF